MGVIGVIERYRDRLPVGPGTPELTLGEGSTPLIPPGRLGEQLGVDLHFKFEGMNPTGSFKDRGMVVAVAKAIEDGADGIICASTGNTAASAAAYAARAGLTAVVLCPAGAIAAAKLAQSRAVGARVLEVRGSFDEALASCRELVEQRQLRPRQLAQPEPDRGAEDGRVRDRRGARPRARRARAPLRRRRQHRRLREGLRARTASAPRMISAHAIERAITIASAIRIAEPAHLAEVEALIADGRVEPVPVSDDDITRMWLELASLEGIFCEPSSAAGLAALATCGARAGAAPSSASSPDTASRTPPLSASSRRRPHSSTRRESILAEVSR